MVMGKSPIVPTTWVAHGQPPKWCKWGSADGHTTWWREAALVGDG
jgi:hypothetical protein